MDSVPIELEFLRDKYAKLILKSTITPKSATQISRETKIPIGTVYRRLDFLKSAGFLKVQGFFENGNKIMTYHNRSRRYNVLNPRIVLLLEIINKNPGICYRDIQKLSGYPLGTLSNSLSNLERDSKIIVKRLKRRTHYFPLHIPSEEFLVIINLRKETTKRIILFLLENKKATFSEIRNHSNKSPSTISITLTHLIENKIINRINGLEPYFELNDDNLVQNTLTRIDSSILDKLKDRMADTFSYF